MARHDIVPEESQVWIEGSSSVHPIRATASGLVGWVELASSAGGASTGSDLAGEVRIAVDRLRSGNALVDRETRRRIDAGKHPEITGTVTSGRRLAPGRMSVAGVIAFRGEEREVTGELEVNVLDDGLVIEGSQRFDVRDWGLQPPRVALLRVHPEIDVRIRVVAAR